MRDIGLTISGMEKDLRGILMEKLTLETLKLVKLMEMESIPGLMEESTTENGRMEDSTAKASTYLSRASTDLVSGKMVKERDG